MFSKTRKDLLAIHAGCHCAGNPLGKWCHGDDLNSPAFGDPAIVTVRLINKRTGQAVSDAVISAKRIDMAPDGMATMAAPIRPEKSNLWLRLAGRGEAFFA
jgi:YtkA-like